MEVLGVFAAYVVVVVTVAILRSRFATVDAAFGEGHSSKVRAARRQLWRRAARLSELASVEESAAALTGRKGRFEVRLESWSDNGQGTRIVVSGLRSGHDASLSLQPERWRWSGPDPREVDIGDEDFDRAVSVQGSPTLARAVLDATTRRAVAGLVRGNMPVPGRTPLRITGELGDGELRILVPEATVYRIDASEDKLVETSRGFLAPEERLPEVLQFGLNLASRVDEPGDVARRIAQNTAHEPEPRVRESNLLALVREFPDSPATRETLLAALEDPDAVVRLQAGIALRQQGQAQLDDHLVRVSRDVLRALAAGEGAEDATSARAMAALGTDLSGEEAQLILHDALRTRRTATATACLGVLAARGGAEAIRAMAKVLAVERDELAAAAADALSQTGDPKAEEPLLRALSDGSRAVQLSALRALGRVGSSSSVASLREAESGGGEMRRAARQAVAEIQARLAEAAGAAPGQLSLAGGEAGQVSLAGEDAAGRLTLVGEGAPARGSSEDAGEEASARQVPREPAREPRLD
jgi:HEAT repeat protein